MIDFMFATVWKTPFRAFLFNVALGTFCGWTFSMFAWWLVR